MKPKVTFEPTDRNAELTGKTADELIRISWRACPISHIFGNNCLSFMDAKAIIVRTRRFL